MQANKTCPFCQLDIASCSLNNQRYRAHIPLFKFDASDWLDDQDVISMFRISLSTLERLQKRKVIPFVRLAGKKLYSKWILYQKLYCLMET